VRESEWVSVWCVRVRSRAPKQSATQTNTHMRLLYGNIDVVAPISAPMLQIVAMPVHDIVSTPGPKYSTIAPVPPLTVRMPATCVLGGWVGVRGEAVLGGWGGERGGGSTHAHTLRNACTHARVHAQTRACMHAHARAHKRSMHDAHTHVHARTHATSAACTHTHATSAGVHAHAHARTHLEDDVLGRRPLGELAGQLHTDDLMGWEGAQYEYVQRGSVNGHQWAGMACRSASHDGCVTSVINLLVQLLKPPALWLTHRRVQQERAATLIVQSPSLLLPVNGAA
jgi:hypothetical protein